MTLGPERLPLACDHEEATVKELSDAAGLTQSSTLRNLRSLGPPDLEWSRRPALNLLMSHVSPLDGRPHVVPLSPRGRSPRHRLEVMGRTPPAR
jgi:hypothetical protein